MNVALLNAYLPLLLALLALVGGGIAYNWHKNIDRKNEILQERRELYRRFIAQVQRLRMHVFNTRWENFDEWYYTYKELMGEIFVTAPDDVMKAIIELDRAVTTITHTRNRGDDPAAYDQLFEQVSKLYFALILEMRKDSFGNTVIAIGDLSTFSEEYQSKRLSEKKE